MNDIINLAYSENSNLNNNELVDLLSKELKYIYKYPVGKIRGLEKKILEDLELDEEYDVFLGNGLDEVVYVLLSYLVRKFNSFIGTKNTFNGYKYATNALGCNWEEASTDKYKINISSIVNIIDKKNSCIFICNPHNPFGTIIPIEEIVWLIDQAKQKESMVVLDETYMDFVIDKKYKKKCWDIFLENENVVVLRSFSKFYGLAGLRVGYMVYHKSFFDFPDIYRDALPFRIGMLSCNAVEYCINNKEKYCLQSKKISQMREYMYQELDSIGIKYIKSETNFILVNLNNNSENISKKLKDENNIIVRDCNEFGLSNHIRISVGNRDEIDSLFDALKKCMKDN